MVFLHVESGVLQYFLWLGSISIKAQSIGKETMNSEWVLNHLHPREATTQWVKPILAQGLVFLHVVESVLATLGPKRP